ncbi:MAG TPA: hypothetical protein VLU25_17850 [Acidobacteriota bacterium]|nr:hypothetical protein [Acidobacteriota bacterium]
MTDASVSKMRPALIGGLVLGVASGIPFVNALNCACCLWVIIGGVLASYLYLKESTVAVSYGDAAVLGLLTGIVGAVISTVVSFPITLLFNIGGASEMQEALEQLRSNPDIPPEFVEFFEWMVESGMLGAGFSVIGLLFSLLVFALFAMLGAIIGVAVFQKDKGSAPPPPAASDTVPSTPPPPSGGTGGASGGGASSSSGASSSGRGAAAPPSSSPSGGAASPSAPSPPAADESSEDKPDS